MSPFAVLAARWFGVAPGTVRMITDGVNKTLRVVSDHDDAFVRFSPTSLHSRKALINEAALIATLREQDIPCCELVAIDGCSVHGPHIVNGLEYNVLLTHTIAGSVLASTAHDARAFGHSLARLHRTPIKGPTRMLAISGEGEIDPMIRPVFEELTGLVQQLSDTPSASDGICHGDAWLGNAINRDGTAVLFDFEFFGHGPLAYDIATFIWALRAEGNEAEALIYASFLEGYRGEYDLPLSEHDLRVNLLRKEINNIRFLCQNITMSHEVKVATAKFARDTLDFALGSRLSRFAWT